MDHPSPNGQAERVRTANPPITISYADDPEHSVIYWRCESGDCPSRISEPGRDMEPFVGTITYKDRQHAFTMLGAVAVAHATLLDQAPLAEMRVEAIQEGARQ